MNDAPVRLHLRLLEVPVVLDVPRRLHGQLCTALRALGPTDDAGPDAASLARSVLLRPDGAAWTVRVDGGALLCHEDPVGLVVTALTQVAVRHTPLLGVHAGALAAAAGTVVLPGPSGLGKSTLVACALREGFGYLSDEVLAIDRSTGAVAALPRPLALDATAWRLAGLPERAAPEADAERLLPPDDLGVVGRPAPITAIVLARRATDGPTVLEQATPGEAVTSLLRHSFNHYRDSAGSLARVVALARSAALWRARYADARDLAATLADRL